MKYHWFRSTCAVAMVISSGVASAQLLGRAGVAGGVTGAATGAVSGGAVPVGAVGSVTDTANGGLAAGAGGGRAIGAADAVTAIQQNAVLSSSVQQLLPMGMGPAQAAAGFGDTAQLLTALHAAHDMNIPFEQFKSATTGKGHVSFDKAARKLRPDLDEKTLKENLKLAEMKSNRDLMQASAPAGKDRVASRMTSDAALSSRVSALLPQGKTAAAAATGFHDEDQFLSTAQASHNLSLPFDDMKDRVTAGQSLSDAIHAMKPGMSESESRASAQTASSQAAELRRTPKASLNANAGGDADFNARQSGASSQASADASASGGVKK